MIAVVRNLLLLALIFSLTPHILSAKEIKIAGGAAPMNNIFKPIKEEFESKTGIYLNLIEIGPKLAMVELLKGNVDTACAGLKWEGWLDLMKKEMGMDLRKEDFQIYEIGVDEIVVIVNPENPVTSLNKEQLKGIFTGRIKNWKEVGGKDENITVVWGQLIPGTNKLFSEAILDGERVTPEAMLIGDVNDIKEAVASLPEAIGIGPMSLKNDPSVKTVETPKIQRPIICVTKRSLSSELQKLFDFLKSKK